MVLVFFSVSFSKMLVCWKLLWIFTRVTLSQENWVIFINSSRWVSYTVLSLLESQDCSCSNWSPAWLNDFNNETWTLEWFLHGTVAWSLSSLKGRNGPSQCPPSLRTTSGGHKPPLKHKGPQFLAHFWRTQCFTLVQVRSLTSTVWIKKVSSDDNKTFCHSWRN